MTPGEKLFESLLAAREKAGGTLTQADWIAAADQAIVDLQVLRKRKPRRLKTDRPRNLLFDSLALGTGCRDISQITRNGAKAVGVALADIREVAPGLTVEEIDRVVAAYRNRHPTWPCTATAIAKHWAEFAATAATRAAKRDLYVEPALWSGAAKALYGDDVGGQMVSRGWFELGTDMRADILRQLNQPKKGNS